MKVLIIDDEPLVRRSLSRALQIRQHEVFMAENGTQGLQLWQECHPEVVFLDVLMPGLTGPQVLQNLAPALRSLCKVIMMSAYTGSSGQGLDQTSDVDLFLLKPFADIFKVVETAEELLTHGRG